MSPRSARTAVPVHPLVADRWSPRAFDATHEISDAALLALLEAARWAPSAFNRQPWRFLVGRRDDATYKAIFDALAPGNQSWAGAASALVVAVAQGRGDDGADLVHAPFELGLAVAQLTVQAHAEGLHVHQMAGFSPDQLIEAFRIPVGFTPLIVLAVGAAADDVALPDELRRRERAPRQRRPLGEIAYAEEWGNAAVA